MSRTRPLRANLLFVLVCLAAIPLGANRPWAWIALALLAGLLLLWQAAGDLAELDEARKDLRALGLAPWLFLAVAVWVFLQTADWLPAAWLHPAYGALDVPGRVSVWPERTAQFGLRLLAYGMIFWMALRAGRDVALARRGLAVFAVFSSALAVYGLTLALLGSETLLWFDKWAMRGYVTATFVNKNSYATYAGLGLLVNLVLLLDSLKHLWRRESMTRRVAARLWLTALATSALPWLLGVLLTGTALLATASRGGFLATVAGTLVLLLALLIAWRGRFALPLALALLLPVFAFLLWNASEAVLLRLADSDVSSELRTTVYQRLLRAIEDAGALGTGFGGFQEAFRPYKSEALGAFTWDLAHSTYLENALELGWPAALALLLAILGPVVRCAKALRTRRRRVHFAALGLGASALVGLHATVDFSLQMPAIAAAYALLLGLCWAQAWPTSRA